MYLELRFTTSSINNMEGRRWTGLSTIKK